MNNTHKQSEDILPFLTSLRRLDGSGLGLEVGLGLVVGGLRLALTTQMCVFIEMPVD